MTTAPMMMTTTPMILPQSVHVDSHLWCVFRYCRRYDIWITETTIFSTVSWRSWWRHIVVTSFRCHVLRGFVSFVRKRSIRPFVPTSTTHCSLLQRTRRRWGCTLHLTDSAGPSIHYRFGTRWTVVDVPTVSFWKAACKRSTPAQRCHPRRQRLFL
jgi:hypothetical protein